MILSLIRKAGVDRFNTFVREKLSASLRMVALTTLEHTKLGAELLLMLLLWGGNQYSNTDMENHPFTEAFPVKNDDFQYQSLFAKW